MRLSGGGWARTSKFDVFDNTTGAVVARNVDADSAATTLRVTAQAIVDGVSNYSFVDANGYRCAGHGQITGAP